MKRNNAAALRRHCAVATLAQRRRAVALQHARALQGIQVKNVKDVELDLVWDPPWDKSMMSEAAKLELNL